MKKKYPLKSVLGNFSFFKKISLILLLTLFTFSEVTLAKSLTVVNGYHAQEGSETVQVSGCIGESISIRLPFDGRNFSWNLGGSGSLESGGDSKEALLSYNRAGTYFVTVSYTDDKNQAQTQLIEITIEDCCNRPMSIQTSQTTVCAGTPISVSASNNLTDHSYSWNFGGGSSGTNSGVGPHWVSWDTPGTKTITLNVVQNECNCFECDDIVLTTTVTVLPLPSVDIEQSKACKYVNSAINFNTSYTSGATYSWSAPGSTSSSGSSTTSFTATWSTTGYKTVILEATLNGCVAVEQIQVPIIDATCPDAVMALQPTLGCQNQLISMSASDQGFGVEYVWNFGSGALVNGSGKNVSVKFTTPGTKNVTLTVKKCGCADDTYSFDIVVKPTPTVTLSGPTCGEANTNLNFSTPVSGISGTTYSWTAAGATGITSSNSVNLSWSTTGAKIVCVNASADGCTSPSACMNVDIVTSSCPQAIFSLPSGICQGSNEVISATDQGFGVTYSWYEASSSSGPYTLLGTGLNYTYNPSTSGTKYIKLITSKCQCTPDEEIHSINIAASPSASLTGPIVGLLNTNYTFTTTAVTGATYQWFVDNVPVSGSSNSITLNFSTEGYKSITVIVTKNGCSTSSTHVIGIIDTDCPEALFDLASTGCAGDEIILEARDQGCYITYSWNINGVTITGRVLTYTFAAAGTYNVTLTVTNCGCNGCAPSILTKTITINPLPVVEVMGPNTLNVNETGAFTTLFQNSATYQWTTNGGTGTSVTNDINVYWSTPGSKNICVTSTLNGCEATDCHELIIIGTPPVCYYPSTFQLSADTLHTPVNMLHKTDGGNTTLDYKLVDLNNVVTTLRTDTLYPRPTDPTNHADSIVCVSSLPVSSTYTIKHYFNHDVTDVNFSVYDLDFDSTTFNQDLIECVEVKAWDNNVVINLTQTDYTLGGFVEKTGNNRFCNLTGPVPNTSLLGDIDIHLTQNIDSVFVVYFLTHNNYNGSLSPTLAIGDIHHCSAVPLPVTWLNVKAVRVTPTNAEIKWTTASEINNDYFEILKSVNGSPFRSIGTVKGAGNSISNRDYVFLDNDASENEIQYQIKQVDFNGDFSYSNKVWLANPKTTAVVYPNPTAGILNIESDVKISGQTEFIVSDIYGKKVLIQTATGRSDRMTMDVSSLSNGIYILSYTMNDQLISTKFIVTK